MRPGKRARVLVAAVALTCASTNAADKTQETVDGAAYTAPSRLVEVEPGRRLNLHCVGTGEPVVVFEGGLTEPINTWGLVQPAIGLETTACAYDRAGIGFSDPLTRPATASHMVDDLRRLLAAANLRPPYVLVAASSGALNARLFAYSFPDDVAGLVLVDPSHEDQTETFRKFDPRGLSPEAWDAQVIEPSLALRRRCIQAVEKGIKPGSEDYAACRFPQYPQLSPAVQEATEAFQMTATFQKTQLSEEENVFRATVLQLKAARRSLGALPVLVLSQDRPPLPAEPRSPEETTRRNARYDLWLSLGRASAASSERGEVRVVAGAGHAIALEKPESVVIAVRDVMRAATARPGQ